MAIITLSILVIATYSDIRWRMSADWLSYALLFSALGVRALFAIELGWQLFISGVIGTLLFFFIALVFYYTKQWGGADSKILMGMGAVIGADFIFIQDAWELLFYFILVLLVGAIYGLIWSIGIAIMRRKAFKKSFKKLLKGHKKEHLLSYFFTILLVVAGLFIPVLLILAIFPIFAFYLFLFAAAVEDSCFYKTVHAGILTVGDYVAEDIMSGKKKIFHAKTVDKKDIRKLMHLEAEDRIDNIIIKEGIPFIPSFLFAYLLLLFAQDFLAMLLRFFF